MLTLVHAKQFTKQEVFGLDLCSHRGQIYVIYVHTKVHTFKIKNKSNFDKKTFFCRNSGKVDDEKILLVLFTQKSRKCHPQNPVQNLVDAQSMG